MAAIVSESKPTQQPGGAASSEVSIDAEDTPQVAREDKQSAELFVTLKDTVRPNRQWIATVLVAVLGVCGTVLAGWLGANATAGSISSQLAEQRAASDRVKRAEVYSVLLKDSRAAVMDLYTAALCTDPIKANLRASGRPGQVDDETLVRSCPEQVRALNDGLTTLRSDVDEVGVWGSKKAQGSARKVLETLYGNRVNPFIYDFTVQQGALYEGAADDFMKVMCSELPAQPRADC